MWFYFPYDISAFIKGPTFIQRDNSKAGHPASKDKADKAGRSINIDTDTSWRIIMLFRQEWIAN